MFLPLLPTLLAPPRGLLAEAVLGAGWGALLTPQRPPGAVTSLSGTSLCSTALRSPHQPQNCSPPVTQTRGGRADPMVHGPDVQGALSTLQLPSSFMLVSLFWNSPSQAGVGAGPSSACSHLRPQLLSVRAVVACADNLCASVSPSVD